MQNNGLRKINSIRFSNRDTTVIRSTWIQAEVTFSLAVWVFTTFLAILLTLLFTTATNASPWSARPVTNGPHDSFDPAKFQTKVFAAIDKAMPAVVAVRERAGGTFSAVIVSEDGLVLSAGHAVRPNGRYTLVLNDGRRVSAVGLGSNERVDCAMLKITQPGPWPTAELGDSSSLVVNQACISISHPGQFNPRRGPVVRLGRIIDPLTSLGMIHSTAKMEPGDSGGPLIDLEGRVIGIHSNIRRQVDRNFDVPIEAFRKYWDLLETPEKFEVSNWPSLPPLGFQIEINDDGDALNVTKVKPQTIAQRSGLQVNDSIVSFADRRVDESKDLVKAIKSIAVNNKNRFPVSIRRDGKPLQLWFEVPTDKDAAIPQLAALEDSFVDLESKLDDSIVTINSTIGGDSKQVLGTIIKSLGLANVVSKSSLVGDTPQVTYDGQSRSATIVRRDDKNDMILLKVDLPAAGIKSTIDVNGLPGDMFQQPGKLLLTPDPNGKGTVSIWGSNYFSVPRTRNSSGYLGVEIAARDNEVFLARVQNALPAAKAGLKRGDVLVQIGNISIKRDRDVFNFLKDRSPNEKVKLVISREGNQFEKEVTLGQRPEFSGHVADQLPGGKSVRRDGFDMAITHDADIRPTQCGGPVFNLKGEFLGINIARNSRTQCYIVPKTVIQKAANQ